MNNKLPRYLVLLIALSATAGVASAADTNNKAVSQEQGSQNHPELIAMDTADNVTEKGASHKADPAPVKRGAFGDQELDWFPSAWYSAY